MMILLTSCAAANLGDRDTKAMILPDVPNHPVSQQLAAADELEKIMKMNGGKSAVLEMLKSCHVVQQETRAAQKLLKVGR